MSHNHLMNDMDMSSMTMTMTGSMSTPTASSSNSMGMNMGMGSMSMYFTTSINTSLWSQAWTPSSKSTYAATCIFLIVFAIISRLIGLFRERMEQKWHDAAVNRRYIIVNDMDGNEGQIRNQAKVDDDAGVLTTRGIEETVKVIKAKSRSKERVPFRLSVDLPRSCIYVVQAGVGYLLMLAVMTFNVGYFMSVLAGLFAGELLVGRYTSHHGVDH